MIYCAKIGKKEVISSKCVIFAHEIIQLIDFDMKKYLVLFFLVLNSTISFAQDKYKVYCSLIGDENSLKRGIVDVRIDYGQENLKDNKFVDENGEEIKFHTMISTMNFMSKLGWNLEQVYNSYDKIDGSLIIIWVLSKEVSSDKEITEGFQTKKMFKEKVRK